MKKQILLLVSILLYNFVFAQPEHDFSILVGKYDGLIMNPNDHKTSDASSLEAELFADFTFAINIIPKGQSSNKAQVKLIPLDVIEGNNILIYPFKISGVENETLIVEFVLTSPSAARQGVTIILPTREDRTVIYLTNRQGGNPEFPITKQKTNQSSKQANKKIQQYLDNTRWNINGFANSSIVISETISKVNQSDSRHDYQYNLNEVIRKIDGLNAGTKGAIAEIENAIREARNSECTRTQEILEKTKEALVTAKNEFISAQASTRQVLLESNSDDVDKNGENFLQHINLAFEEITAAEKLMIYVEQLTPCYNTSPGPIITSNSNSADNNYIKPNLAFGEKVGLDCERTYGKVFVVKKIIPGWAGAKAGIRVGDEILEINGTTVKGMIEIDMDLLFLGKKGTSVKVKVQKKNDPTPHTYHMIRGEGGTFTEEEIKVAKDEMPSYSGSYEGDDLLKLLGRDVEDKAIKKLISLYDLKRNKNCSYEEVCRFNSMEGISLFFRKRKLTAIFLQHSSQGNGQFSKKAPLVIPLAKPHSLMDSFGKDWEQKGERYWKKTINNIEFKVRSEAELDIVNSISISADDNMDWVAYHKNLDYSAGSEKTSTFSGEYAGDNLLKLMGREIDDPAIIKWFENPDAGFQKSKHYKCTDEFCIYQSEKYGINLRFEERKLTQFSFYNHKQNSKITAPFNVPVGKPIATFKPESKGFTLKEHSTNFWRKEDIKFIYTITTDRKTNAIEWFTIYGEK